jgi:fibronectin type 3 domain-containing protein
MGRAFSRSCVLAIVVVACAVVSAPAFAASQPIGLTAVARSDHLVELTWSWPASPTYPDELDVYRDGAFVASVSPASSTSFADTITSLSAPGTSHTYYLVTVVGGSTDSTTPTTPAVTLRQDLPNKPTNVAASFGAGTNNIATVTWKRGAMDADVTYTVTAQQVGGGPINTRTVKYPDDGTDGSLTMDGFSSFTSYVFQVSAVEDVGDPSGDPGGTADADQSATAQSFDVLPPQFSGGTLPTATTVSLGTIAVTWPPATDAGSGVASYTVCIDGAICTSVPFDPLAITQTATPGPGLIRNDGAVHTVSVVAVDAQNNQSTPITAPLTMPLPATPVLGLSAVNGCAPLIVTPTSSDGGLPAPTFHVFANGSEIPFGPGNPITGAPYQEVTLTATATYGLDSSLTSAPFVARVEDPTQPTVSPQVHGTGSDTSSGIEVLDWDGVVEPTGAPIIGYLLTSSTISGYENGKFVAQADHVQQQLTGLTPSDGYTVDVSAVDACQRQGPPAHIHFKPNDNSPPTAPVLNTPVAGGYDVKLSWAPSTDDVAVDDYYIYKNGVRIAETTLTSYDVSPLPEAYPWTFTVVANDTAGNRSAPSNARTVTTLDMTPPSPPGGLPHASSQGGNISLSWGYATDNVAVAGYQLFRLAEGQTTPPTLVYQGGPTVLSFTDKGVPAGKYTYSVVAFDAAGHVSTPKTVTALSTGTPMATKATVQLIKSKGTKVFVVGGSSGARIVLLFRLKQPFVRAVVRLQVLKVGVTGKAVPKVRVSLPAGSGRTTPGKRLGERIARKGTISIPVGHMKASLLRLVVTATGGTLTLAGTRSTHAPMIVSGS